MASRSDFELKVKAFWRTALVLVVPFLAVIIIAFLTRDFGTDRNFPKEAWFTWCLAGTCATAAVSMLASIYVSHCNGSSKWAKWSTVAAIGWVVGALVDSFSPRGSKAEVLNSIRLVPDVPAILSLTILFSCLFMYWDKIAPPPKARFIVLCCGAYVSLYLQLSQPNQDPLSLVVVHLPLILMLAGIGGIIASHDVGHDHGSPR